MGKWWYTTESALRHDNSANDAALSIIERSVCTIPFGSPVDPDENTIIADVGAVFAGTDLTLDTQCHSAGDGCAPMFEQIGVDWETGNAAKVQKIYRVE